MDELTDGDIAERFRPALTLAAEWERLAEVAIRLDEATEPAEVEAREAAGERIGSLGEEIGRSAAQALKAIGLWQAAAMIDAGLAIPHEVWEDLVERYPPYPPAAPVIELEPRRSWKA